MPDLDHRPLRGDHRPPREARPPSAAWLLPVSLLSLVIYLATWSAVHSWDSIAYTARVLGDPLLSEAFLSTSWLHPHHLLYVPLGQLAALIAGPLTRNPFAPLLLLSSLSGAGTVALGAWLAWRAAGTRAAGLAAAGILTFANTTWLYATLVEVMMPALCFLLAAGAFLALRGWKAAALAGLAVALATLTHQIAVLYAVAWSVGLVLLRDRRTAVFVFAWVIPVGVVYVAAAVFYAGARTPPEIVGWAVAAGSRSEGATSGIMAAVYEAARTAAESLVTLVPVTRLRAGTARDAWTIVGAVAALFVLAGATVGLWRALRAPSAAAPRKILPIAGDEAPGDPSAQRVLTGLLGGSLATSVFIAWFQARTIDYWVYVVAGVAVWACGRLPRITPGPFAAWLLVLAAVNYGFRVLPMRDAANAPYADFSRFASGHMTRGDRFWLGPGDKGLEHALVVMPFYYGVEVDRLGPLDEAAREHRSDRRRRAALPPSHGRVFVTESALAWVPPETGGLAKADSVGSLRGTRVYLLRAAPP